MTHDKFCPERTIVGSVCMCDEIADARADEREQAAQRVSELTFGWKTVERFIVGEAIAAARGGEQA